MTGRFVFTAFTMLLAVPAIPGSTRGSDAPGGLNLDWHSACGPVAGYIALRSLGHSATLDEVARGCKWTPGNAVSLSDLSNYLNGRKEINCRGVRLTAEQLREFAASDRFVVILLIKRPTSGFDHVVCITALDGDEATVVDYPGMCRQLRLTDILELWDGEALLVSQNIFYEVGLPWLATLLALVVLAATLLLSSWKAKHNRRRSKKEIPQCPT